MIHSVPIKRKRRARRPQSTPCKSVKKRLILAEKPLCRAAFWRAAAGPQRRAPSASRTRPSSNRWRHTSVPSSSSTGTSSS
ncbi:hypothetical protein DIE19_13745 [Burkholderia sp. Bp9126]|nr:hypothetical protein DIE19_13745 [Burkholderia sp. Bp9126]